MISVEIEYTYFLKVVRIYVDADNINVKFTNREVLRILMHLAKVLQDKQKRPSVITSIRVTFQKH